jgi:peptide subunit release factor 1 (eRF1)
MMTRDDLRELAQFQLESEDNCALSFYFQPRTPHNKSHREEAILAKDLVRQALRELKANSAHKPNGSTAEALGRILRIAEGLDGDRAHAKAVFACARTQFWREFDLPPQLAGTRLVVGRRFYLRPLAELLGAQPRLGVAVVDRQRARLFDLRLDVLTEREGLFRPLPRRGRSDGYAGYDAGHAERRVADDALHHFKHVAERLKEQAEQGVWERLIIGCHEQNWPELEAQLHPYVAQRLLGHFPADVHTASAEQISEQASRILLEFVEERRRKLVESALNQARGHGRGVTGLRKVLEAVERGEAQTLMIGEGFTAHAVECSACGHLDSHLVSSCAVCGAKTHELEDIGEALVPLAIRHDTELLYVADNAELDRVGNIAALLRYQTQKENPSIAAAS